MLQYCFLSQILLHVCARSAMHLSICCGSHKQHSCGVHDVIAVVPLPSATPFQVLWPVMTLSLDCKRRMGHSGSSCCMGECLWTLQRALPAAFAVPKQPRKAAALSMCRSWRRGRLWHMCARCSYSRTRPSLTHLHYLPLSLRCRLALPPCPSCAS